MTSDWRHGLPILRGEGFTLQEPRLADASALFIALSTPAVTRYISSPPHSADGFARFIGWAQHGRQRGRHLCYAIVPDGSTVAVGMIQMREIEPAFGTAEWGFALAEPHWGTGIFAAAARLFVDFAFRHVGVHRLEARTSVRNGRGNGLLQKMGAAPEGVLRRSFSNGEVQTDQLLWSLIADDWLARHDDLAYTLTSTAATAPETEAPRSTTIASGAWRQQLPQISGDGLRLREVEPADGPALTEFFRDQDLSRYIPPPPTDLDGFGRFVAWARRQREAGQYLCYAVVPDGAPAAVGIFQIHQMEPPFRTAEWGFVFGKPYWGTGLLARSAEPMLDFIFDTLGVARLEARAMAANVRANGLLRKLGASQEGRLRGSFLLGGEYHDDLLWSILDTDWARRRAAAHAHSVER